MNTQVRLDDKGYIIIPYKILDEWFDEIITKYGYEKVENVDRGTRVAWWKDNDDYDERCPIMVIRDFCGDWKTNAYSGELDFAGVDPLYTDNDPEDDEGYVEEFLEMCKDTTLKLRKDLKKALKELDNKIYEVEDTLRKEQGITMKRYRVIWQGDYYPEQPFITGYEYHEYDERELETDDYKEAVYKYFEWAWGDDLFEDCHKCCIYDGREDISCQVHADKELFKSFLEGSGIISKGEDCIEYLKSFYKDLED